MMQLRRRMALLLAVAMLAGMTACVKKAPQADAQIPAVEEQVIAAPEKETTQENALQTHLEAEPAPTVSAPVADEDGNVVLTVDTSDRESLEQIVELLGSDKKPGKLNDKELGELAEDLLEDLENDQKTDGIVDLENQDQPVVDFDESAYDEDGAITKPFDQVYPELVENGQVEFDDETLLIKMKNSRKGKISDGMKKAGVADLEAVVPMEDTTWYEAKLKKGTEAVKAVEALRKLKEVLLVEYNYEVQPASIDGYQALPAGKGYENNTLLKDQWYLNHCGIPAGMEKAVKKGGDSSVIVAVIDSGVDYDHEDLKENIWVNKKEIPDNNIDDDNNGYIDDYYGVDIVAGKGNGDDNHGHGTHVAGIIAAQNNNMGTLGIAYNVKIMPIKAGSAYLLQSDIAKAIYYAYENGAEVINMSFGGGTSSIAVQDALATAFTRCVLVASAGNNGMHNEGMDALPNYPAALTYVLGVMSIDQAGRESVFTNYDVLPFSGVEYELYAPGDGIMSTLPNDQYGILSGTSMAAPMVSAMAAILRSEYADRNTYPTRFIYGQLTSTSGYCADCFNPSLHGNHNIPQVADLNAALTKLPEPELGVQDYAFFDTAGFSHDEANANNGDGVLDAGETIALGLTLRNRWGQSKDTAVTIDTLTDAGIPDPYVQILTNDINYGSVGTYATGDCGKIYTDEIITGWENPFYLRISKDCPNDYAFTLNVTITCGNGMDERDTATYAFQDTLLLKVRNGVILPQFIEEDMTLTKDNYYIIPNATVIDKGVTVTVEPGTQIQFWSNDREDPYADSYIASLTVKGTFLVEGTKEEPVCLFPGDGMDQYIVELKDGGGYVSMRYADVTNLAGATIHYAEHCDFLYNYNTNLLRRRVDGYTNEIKDWSVWGETMASFQDARYCSFYKVASHTAPMWLSGTLDTCIFVDCAIRYDSATTRNCVFLGNYADNAQSEWEKDTNSILQLTLPAMAMGEFIEPRTVFYRPETGTTYVVASQQGGAVTELLRTMGGDFAVINDEAELKWLSKNLASNLTYTLLKISYDHANKCFTWADGSSFASFLKAEKLLEGARPDQEIGLNYNTTSLNKADYNLLGNGYVYLFEIPGEILPTDISFAVYETVLDMDTTYQIVPYNQPVQQPIDAFIYESSDEAVLKVSDTGLVTPLSPGKADVTVYSKDKAVWNHISFEVKDYVALVEMVFPEAQASVAVGETEACGVVLTPDTTTRRNVTYTSSDDSVAMVDAGGNVTGISTGTATITATCEGISAQLPVTVFRKTITLALDNAYRIETMGENETVALPNATFSENADVVLEWTSSDPSVAQIVDGGIAILKSGTTAIIATDKNSGMQASQQLYVLDTARSLIVDMQFKGDYFYVLCENGNLYSWSEMLPDPVLLMEDVKAFNLADQTQFFILKQDNTVFRGARSTGDNTVYQHETYDTFKDLNPVGVATDGSSYFVWTENGTVYAWGQGTGLGSMGYQKEPVMLNLDAKIVQVKVSNALAMFLADSGDLYAASDALSANEPIRIAERVTNLTFNTGESNFCYTVGDVWYVIAYYSEAPIMLQSEYHYLKPTAYDLISRDGTGYVIGVRGNQIDYVSGWKVFTLPGTYNNVTSVHCDCYGNYWFTTAEGMLYGFGSNSYNGLAGTVSGATDEAVMIPVGLPVNETMTFTGTNLGEGNVLTDDTLELHFSKKLANHSGVQLLENGTAITATIQHDHNKITLSRAAGFKTGATYTVKVNAGRLAGLASAALAENLELTFTYEEAELVTHEAQKDSSIRKYWDVLNLREHLLQRYSELSFNERFYNNAILNRISTDTDVGHWLRPTANGGSGTEVPLGGIWWGTTNESAIDLQIFDYHDLMDYSKIVYKPFLTEAPSNTFPFVTAVTVLDKDGKEVKTAGMEEVTVRVTFNRDMDTSIPLNVMFGSAYPYADYEITEGKFINKRTWEGKYFISSVMGNGYQYFTISNGQSATDNLELFTDRMRFAFQVDTTAAQALLMQGYATDTGIQLSWTQDDFDTLMGYNIYRSDAEDGLYTRINQTVIPAGTMNFFDDTVEPGKLYYYNFTVVQSDMTESAPSGKIHLMSKDTMAPNIYHSPVYEAFTGENLIISATVTDNLNIAYTKVYYRTTGTTSWKTSQMNNLNDKYSAIIPASDVTTAGLEYYLEASDGISYTYKGSAEVPYKITVKKAVTKDSLGDVNGDGKISNLDALMLLQAINDLLNLSSEQFMRADLNGNGILEAREALRILQYVSGTVGSLKM